MMTRIGRIVKRGLPFATPTAVLGASLLNLTTVERQALILVMLVWMDLSLLLKAWQSQ